MLRWWRMLVLLLAVSPSSCTLSRIFRPRPIVVVNGAILTGHPSEHSVRYIHRDPRFLNRFRNRGPGLAGGVSFGAGIFRKTIRMITPAFNLAHTRISLVFQAPTIRRLDGFLNEVVENIQSSQNRELEDEIDLSETFNTAFKESDGQLAPPPKRLPRHPHSRPNNSGPYGSGDRGHGHTGSSDRGRPGGPDRGRPGGPDSGRPSGPNSGRPGGPNSGRPNRPGDGWPQGQNRDGRDLDFKNPFDDPYGMNITIASPIVANEIKLLNASIYVAVVRLVIPLSQGGLNANATTAGHARVRAASGNFSAAISSLNNLRSSVDPKNKHARELDEASDRLIDDMNYMNRLLRNDGNQNEIADTVAKMIYDSVPVLNALVLADVPPDRISAFFLNVIEGIVSVVVGETMLMASNRSNSMNDVVQFINTALRPLTISASYSTMTEPDFNGDPGVRDSVPENNLQSDDNVPPRNEPSRDNEDRPVENSDHRNGIVRNDDRPGDNPQAEDDLKDESPDDRDRPRQYSNYDPDRPRYRNPRAGNSRASDYPLGSSFPRGLDRQNPRTRDEPRPEPWDDQRYRDDARKGPWEDSRYRDRTRQNPWYSARAADSVRLEPWEDPPSTDGGQTDARNTPNAALDREQERWNGRDAADNANPGPWNNPGGANSVRQNPRAPENAGRDPWDNALDTDLGKQGPNDGTRRASEQ